MELGAPLVLLLATVWHGKSRKGGVREGVTERAGERTLSVAAPHKQPPLSASVFSSAGAHICFYLERKEGESEVEPVWPAL